jgi:hypothetical protein
MLHYNNVVAAYMLPDDDKRYAIETCRSNESVVKECFKSDLK